MIYGNRFGSSGTSTTPSWVILLVTTILGIVLLAIGWWLWRRRRLYGGARRPTPREDRKRIKKEKQLYRLDFVSALGHQRDQAEKKENQWGCSSSQDNVECVEEGVESWSPMSGTYDMKCDRGLSHISERKALNFVCGTGEIDGTVLAPYNRAVIEGRWFPSTYCYWVEQNQEQERFLFHGRFSSKTAFEGSYLSEAGDQGNVQALCVIEE